MDESQNYAERKKADKEHMLGFYLCEIVEQAKRISSNKKHTGGILISRSGKEKLFQRGIN